MLIKLEEVFEDLWPYVSMLTRILSPKVSKKAAGPEWDYEAIKATNER